MTDTAAEPLAFDEFVVFLSHFKDLPDPRQRGKVMYPLDEILLLCLLAVLAGADTFTGIARSVQKKPDLLRRFRPFRDGTPSHDRLENIFASLGAERFQRCFAAWVAALTGAPAGRIAIDGKTCRRTCQKKRTGPHGSGLRRAPAPGARPGQGGDGTVHDGGGVTSVAPEFASSGRLSGRFVCIHTAGKAFTTERHGDRTGQPSPMGPTILDAPARYFSVSSVVRSFPRFP